MLELLMDNDTLLTPFAFQWIAELTANTSDERVRLAAFTLLEKNKGKLDSTAFSWIEKAVEVTKDATLKKRMDEFVRKQRRITPIIPKPKGLPKVRQV